MKITVKPSHRFVQQYTVEVQQGVQSFRLDYIGTMRECAWYARQFREVLKNHNAELLKKTTCHYCQHNVLEE
jgi:hypothetical protein